MVFHWDILSRNSPEERFAMVKIPTVVLLLLIWLCADIGFCMAVLGNTHKYHTNFNSSIFVCPSCLEILNQYLLFTLFRIALVLILTYKIQKKIGELLSRADTLQGKLNGNVMKLRSCLSIVNAAKQRKNTEQSTLGQDESSTASAQRVASINYIHNN